MSTWITTAEVRVKPGDMPTSDVLGFMKIAMWAKSEAEFLNQIRARIAEYQWELLSYENAVIVDPDKDYGDELNDVIDPIRQDQSYIGFGTYYSYKPE
jgi:hypothetical protein